MRRMRARWPIALLVSSLSCARLELPDNPVLPDYSVPQKDFQLDSGLRILVQEDHSTQLVVVAAVYGVGGVADPAGREGLAHFVEHLAFRSRPGGTRQLWDVLKRTGAAFNASTAADLTTYYEIAHKDRLGDLLQIEGWRLTHTLDGVTSDVFDIEREVVRNELRQRGETTVGNRMFDEILAQLYPPQHPLGRPLAGNHQSLSTATLADAQKFVADHYGPPNCTIVIAGDVSTEVVTKLIGKWPAEALYGPKGPGGPKVPHQKRLADITPPPPPPPASTALRRLKGPVDSPRLVLGWSVPGGLRGNDMALSFAGAALNVALSFGIERKEKDELRGVGAGAVPLGDGSIILIQADLRPGANVEAVRKRIMDAVVETWSNDLSGMMVRLGKWGVATDILRASADPVQSALSVAEYLATTGQTRYYKQTLEGLAALRPGAVTDFAYQYLKRERAAAVLFEPEIEGGAAAATGGRLRPGEHELGHGGDVNLSGMGPEDIRRIARPPGVASLPRFKLANGLEVVEIPRPTALMAEVYMQLPGGNATTKPYGLASLAVGRSSSRCEIHGGLMEVGGSVGGGGGELSSFFSVRVMSGNLVNGLAVLADAVTCREADEEAFLDLNYSFKNGIERYKERAKQPQVRARKQFWASLYPDHPYGMQDVDPATLTGITYADASAFVRSHFRPDGAFAAVVGDASPAQLEAMFQKYFAGWTTGATAHRAPPDPGPGPAARAIHLFDRPNATQSSIQIGCRVAKVTAETLPAFDLLEAITTEKAWDLRESWGATYGINAGVQDFPGGVAHMVVQGDVETAKTGDAIDKLLALLATIGSEGPDFKTFVIKRWDVAREYSRNFATGASLAFALLRARTNGWPADLWDRYPGLLADTTRADVRDAAKPCPGHEVVTIVGDAKAVRPQLAAHGLNAQ
jgi:zinc protease